MLSNQEIEETLLRKSIDENDPQKDAKTSEIKHWCCSYGKLLEDDIDEWFDFVADVFKEGNSWKDPQPSGGDQPVKLDREKILKALSNSEYKVNNKKNPIYYADRYQIACWGCLEEDIKIIFEENYLKRYGVDINNINKENEEQLRSRVTRWFESPLASFWSHLIYKENCLIGNWVKSEFSENGYSQFKDLAEKYKDFGEKRYFFIGFEYAAEEGKDDAMKFFIEKIPENHRESILIDTAINHSSKSFAIKFCLNKLNPEKNPEKYIELLKKSYKINNYTSSYTLVHLVSEHYFEEALNLLKPFGLLTLRNLENIEEELGKIVNSFYEDYSSFIYGMLGEMTLLKNDSSFKEIDDFVLKMLSDSDLKVYKELFIKNTSKEPYSPCREHMATLLKKGDKVNKSVFFILDAARKENLLERIISSAEFSLIPYFLTDLDIDAKNMLKSYGITEPVYDSSSESLGQSISSSTSGGEAGSPTVSPSSKKPSRFPNIDLVESKDFDC